MCEDLWNDLDKNEEFECAMERFEKIENKHDTDDSIRLQDNYLIKGMHLMDGDIFVIKTEFNKAEMLYTDYSEVYVDKIFEKHGKGRERMGNGEKS